MILTGPEIKRLVGAGSIEIEPFNEDQVNPASYDLRLGNKVKTYVMHRWPSGQPNHPLDSRKENETSESAGPWGEEKAFQLKPGTLYLMHTAEAIYARDLVCVVDGKSSLGRLGISVHQTAGYGDPGFRGQYTLEVTVVHPVVVYAGMRFCQIRFHTVFGEVQAYDGQYKNETSMGPVASRSWKQFEEDERKCTCVHAPEEHNANGCNILGCNCRSTP